MRPKKLIGIEAGGARLGIWATGDTCVTCGHDGMTFHLAERRAGLAYGVLICPACRSRSDMAVLEAELGEAPNSRPGRRLKVERRDRVRILLGELAKVEAAERAAILAALDREFELRRRLLMR